MRKNVAYEAQYILHQMRSILDRAEKEGRSNLNSDEQTRYGLLEDELDTIQGFDTEDTSDYIEPPFVSPNSGKRGFGVDFVEAPKTLNTFRFWKNPNMAAY